MNFNHFLTNCWLYLVQCNISPTQNVVKREGHSTNTLKSGHSTNTLKSGDSTNTLKSLSTSAHKLPYC